MERMVKKSAFETDIWNLFEPVVNAEGLEIVDVEYIPGKKRAQIRAFLDKPGSRISIGECAKASRVLGALLDVEDPLKGAYDLEVSSPGINRPLVKAEDFNRFSGENVKVKCDVMVDGRRNFQGILRGLEESKEPTVILELNDSEVRLPFANIAKASLALPLDDLLFGVGKKDQNPGAKRKRKKKN